jgi:transcriptional regulator with XRE-family HTH domain
MIDVSVFVSLRNKRELSQAKLAEAAGVSQQLIGEIEASRTRSTKAIYRIARALGTAANILDREIPAIEGLSAKIIEDLRELDEEEAAFHLQNFSNTLDFAKNRHARNAHKSGNNG